MYLPQKKDGSLWAWGYNTGYLLGTGDNIERLTPVQIGNDYDWKKVLYSSHALTIAMKQNGSLWA